MGGTHHAEKWRWGCWEKKRSERADLWVGLLSAWVTNIILHNPPVRGGLLILMPFRRRRALSASQAVQTSRFHVPSPHKHRPLI